MIRIEFGFDLGLDLGLRFGLGLSWVLIEFNLGLAELIAGLFVFLAWIGCNCIWIESGCWVAWRRSDKIGFGLVWCLVGVEAVGTWRDNARLGSAWLGSSHPIAFVAFLSDCSIFCILPFSLFVLCTICQLLLLLFLFHFLFLLCKTSQGRSGKTTRSKTTKLACSGRGQE